MVYKGCEKTLEELEISGRIKTIQTTELLRFDRILRSILVTWGDWLSSQTTEKDYQLKLVWKTHRKWNNKDNGITIIFIFIRIKNKSNNKCLCPSMCYLYWTSHISVAHTHYRKSMIKKEKFQLFKTYQCCCCSITLWGR